MSSCKNNSKKRKVFDETETLIILQTWATDKVQKLFSSMTRHNMIYDIIARKLNECGYNRTAMEVKSKINNLKTEYRKMKPKSGDSTPDWPYYSILHEILGQRDACNNDLLEDSLIDDDESESNTNHTPEIIVQPESEVNESQNIEEDTDVPCGEQTDIESSKSSDSQQPIIKLAQPKIRKISRPPRRTLSKEDALLQSLIQTEKSFQQRLDIMREQEQRNEIRDDMVAQSMNRFLNAFAALAENSIAQGTSAVLNVMPDLNVIPEKTVAKSASTIFHRNMTASRPQSPTIASFTVTSGTHNKCQRKPHINQDYIVDDMDSSQAIIVNENDSQQISDIFVNDITSNESPTEQIESGTIDTFQENMSHENEITDKNFTQQMLNFPKSVLMENQSSHKSNKVIREPIYKKKNTNMLKPFMSSSSKMLPTMKRKMKCQNILITNTSCGLNNKGFNNMLDKQKK